MGIVATVEADLGKVGHAFVMGAAKLKAAFIAVENTAKKAEPVVAEIEDKANALIELVYPQAEVVAQAIEAAMSKVFAAVDAAGDAAASNAVNVQLDAAAVAAIKAALPIVKAQAQTTPGS